MGLKKAEERVKTGKNQSGDNRPCFTSRAATIVTAKEAVKIKNDSNWL